MSKSNVKKHCSVLNYIRHNDKDLYELVQDLCIGRIFTPRRGSPGLTFLHPDKQLLEQIKKMAAGDNPEEAVEALQSLVLLDYLPANSDFDDKKSDIPTFLRKKLPVASVTGAKVTLANGGELVLDKGFSPRKDRANMAVYTLSKALVPTDTEAATFANAKKKNNSKVKGGAEFKANKRELFEQVLADYCDEKCQDRDPAMEVLVTLCQHLSTQGKTAELKAVCSQLSWDTLASLAVVLQPYREQGAYLSAEDLRGLSSAASTGGVAALAKVYAYVVDPKAEYQKFMDMGYDAAVCAKVTHVRDDVSDRVAKLNVVRELASGYQSLASSDTFSSWCPKRAAVLSDKKLALAESELRVFSALLHDNSTGCVDKHEALSWFRDRCNLNQPYMVADKDAMQPSNISFYFSTAYLIARSDGFVYVPGMSGSDLSQIAYEDQKIKLDSEMEHDSRRTYTQSASGELASALAKLTGAPTASE